ncbi:MAG: DEAD/DEAH box helicase [Planctomycetota bacterium]|nr:DEAD/DEAH box helicase [Planctomycetota bacterium]
MVPQEESLGGIAVESDWFSTGIDTHSWSPLEAWSKDISIDFAENYSNDRIAFESLKVLPIQLSQTLPRTIGFAFPESPQWTAPEPKVARPAPPQVVSMDQDQSDPESKSDDDSETAKPRKSITRIRPPGDLVRLEDRLYYVLQPPMETIIQSAKLTFPFQPFPYQLEGIAFLFPRDAAILADEMGLGKTMQAITTIRMLLLSGELKNVLLICPKPLVTNWMREFKQWAPEIPLAIIEGDSAKRNWIWTNPQAPVKIANYELMMRDRDVFEANDLHFDLVVLDEAQRIKNRNSTTSEIVRSIPRTRSWALTGTPIENSVEDLVSIFEFLAPGYLRDDMHLKSLGKATRDYILRRTKDKVLTDMPPKLYRPAELELTGEQRASYRSAEEDGIVQLNEMGESVTIHHVFELVLRLKQICNFDPATGASAKLERLEADLEEIAASGQKAIVFSQWVSTLDLLGERLAKYNPLYYHGGVPSNKRDAVIDQFKNNPKNKVILMSYGAGAVGLNLQFCHYVFLFDRWWNPAVEDQAINRAHRLGVKQPVTVTRMMSLETIEERIHDVLEQKRELFNNLFAETGTPQNLGLSQKEIFGLFGLSVPKYQPKVA